MEDADKHAHISTKGLAERAKGEPPMSDTSRAYSLLDEAFGGESGRSVKQIIADAFKALARREADLGVTVPDDRPRFWTERRVRSIWAKSARRVDNYEIEDLAAVAAEEARIALEKSRHRQARLAALLADPMAYRGRELAHLVRERVGGVDRAGAENTYHTD